MSLVSIKGLVLYVCLVFCACTVAADVLCVTCEDVNNPDVCTESQLCTGDDRTSHSNGQPTYRLGCGAESTCDTYYSSSLVGRDTDEISCRQCCGTDNCNAMLCRDKLVTQNSTTAVMRDCGDIGENGGPYTSGVYKINPDGLSPFSVFCDMRMTPGWTVIQRRYSGCVSFNHTWDVYKRGFGSLDGEFWLGNEYLRRLTSVPSKHYTIKFDITALNGSEYTAYYNNFTVGPESDGYRVDFTSYHGDAGDHFRYNIAHQFSTPDHYISTDFTPAVPCSQEHQAGWWFSICSEVLLNGVYRSDMWWYSTHLVQTTMSISSEHH